MMQSEKNINFLKNQSKKILIKNEGGEIIKKIQFLK